MSPVLPGLQQQVGSGKAIEAELAIPLASPCRVLLQELLHLTLLPGYGSGSFFPGAFKCMGAPFCFQHQGSLPALWFAYVLCVSLWYSLISLLELFYVQ